MELKNAAAVCLISFFSATLVVLIARALDSQAAARLEPHLSQIVTELQALRQQGGVAAAPAAAREDEAPEDGLIVYYFHGNMRCETCRLIESQTRETIESDFASQLHDGGLVWKEVNYEDAATAELTEQFDIMSPVVVLARWEGGQIADWKRLDEVWGLYDDGAAFAELIRNEVRRMLPAGANPARGTGASTIETGDERQPRQAVVNDGSQSAWKSNLDWAIISRHTVPFQAPFVWFCMLRACPPLEVTTARLLATCNTNTSPNTTS